MRASGWIPMVTAATGAPTDRIRHGDAPVIWRAPITAPTTTADRITTSPRPSSAANPADSARITRSRRSGSAPGSSAALNGEAAMRLGRLLRWMTQVAPAANATVYTMPSKRSSISSWVMLPRATLLA